MATKKTNIPTRPRTVGTNALALPFPSDPMGFMSKLKSGGTSAAGRIKGNEDRLKAFKQTLAILAAHADEKFAMDVANREKAKANNVSAKARIEAKRRETAEKRAQEAEANAAAIRARAGIVPVNAAPSAAADETETEE